MKLLALFLLAVHLSLAGLRAEDTIAFPSPNGRFAVRTSKAGGDDEATHVIVEQGTGSIPIITVQGSGRILNTLGGLSQDEGAKVVWSADSCWVAYPYRVGRSTNTQVLFWDGVAFQQVSLPDLPEVEIKLRPSRRRGSPRIVRTISETEMPLRWLRPGVLVLSEETDQAEDLNDPDNITDYRRRYVVTVGYDVKHEGHILKVAKEKQKVSVGQ